ncbi:C-14 sterol reductase [Trichosporon asahii var. asahii CBS 2479]|uniref:Delta(14)-sterol reductase ERG24 n=1 Tax=Trichosporon asahii var. asahii (strain ATCC 90039 / CBS 2479 / JCM 2466 / KCTC 7840 / NBRC 103889/ NCYC 2677 / UAMH 7654) TaxID=1186058 RepID=J5TQQ3_TRIAS|nr:C-14 sterol reductase [Trichosporon asahii var. asahii CBS 2479]EJT52206.1 C-14 sterol reductase [Trichosporon asahii var. asahii CBS 2479]
MPEGEVTTTITATTHVTLQPTVPKTYDELNPRSKPTEFCGPLGTLAVTIGTPLTAYFLYYACNEVTGCGLPTSSSQWDAILNGWRNFPSVAGRLWDTKAALVYLGWYMWCVGCWWLLPGEWIEGTLIRDGTRKRYKMNGTWTLVLTLGVVVGILMSPGGIERFTYLYDHWVPLLTASLVMATAQALWVYFWSFKSGELLALGGNSGIFCYDFFIGRPLNPTFPGFPSFDIKTFNEVRPGIIGWLLLLISCACEQYVRNGRVTDSMWLVLAFEGWYVADCQLNEPSILNQMDITTDGFGFMLSFGDLTWVPFTYSLQARYLAWHPVTLGPAACALVTAVELAGLYIFRVSNNEKSDFRAGRNPKNLKYMDTKRGTKLLTSGWWGRSRHPNYLGDWLMAWAWCLPTGLATPLTYFYVVYFAVLLVHRQMRDDEACQEKYGADWDRYTKLVPYKIIPYVY